MNAPNIARLQGSRPGSIVHLTLSAPGPSTALCGAEITKPRKTPAKDAPACATCERQKERIT